MYLIIAGVTFVVAGIQSRLVSSARRTEMLGIFLAVASLVTGGLWAAADFVSVSSLWILYVWTGLFATLAAEHFWLALSASVTVTDAKRVFGFVGAGALVGAIAGSSIARLLVSFAETRDLVLLAAGTMLLGAAVAHFALRRRLRKLVPGDEAAGAPPTPRARVRAALASSKSDPYARLVVSFVFLSTVALTLVDYLFKRQVAASIAPHELGAFFATFYLVSSGVGLVVQLVLVRWLIDRAGVHRGLSILPVLLVFGGVWAALGSGLSAIMLLKGADGSLRHSLHRTATEILFVPLSDAHRHRVKIVSDVLGHRGGQAAGSVLILVGVWAVDGGAWIAWTIAAVALGAWVVAISARGPYLDVFRRRLGADPDRTVQYLPPLDRSALHALTAALSSANEREVLAALEVLREQGRVDLVPTRVLHHPTARVVEYALQAFVEAGRRDFVPDALRLLDTDDADVRAALLRAIAAVSPDEGALRDALSEPSGRVRATAIVQLCALGRMDAGEARRRLNETADSPAMRRAICAVLAARPHPALSHLLAELAADADRSVRAEAISAIAASGEERLWPVLLASLRERALRPIARRGFLEAGEAGLTFLVEALEAKDLPESVRLHLPRSISAFDSEAAATALVAHLGVERDARVRHKILRALGRLARTRSPLVLDVTAVTTMLVASIARCRLLAESRRAIVTAITAERALDTASGQVLCDVLGEELAFELEQVFRVVGLLHPSEDFHSIHRGFESSDPVTRASSHELVREVLPHDDASALLHLVRVRLGGEVEDPSWAVLSHDAALAQMIEGQSDAVSAMTAAYAADVQASNVRSDIEARISRGIAPELAMVLERAARSLAEGGRRVAGG